MDSSANAEPKFLKIKNWEKYQRAYTNGNRAMWIKSWVDKYSDPDYARLTVFQRHILDGLRDMRGLLGRNPPNDPIWVKNALNMRVGEARYVRRTIEILVKCGFLLLCNEQNSETSSVRVEENRVDKKRNNKDSSHVRETTSNAGTMSFEGQRLKIELKIHEAFIKAYQGTDLFTEYRKMDAWLIANHRNYRDFGRFANTWLSRMKMPTVEGSAKNDDPIHRAAERATQNYNRKHASTVQGQGSGNIS
jgi:hypothetical protein